MLGHQIASIFHGAVGEVIVEGDVVAGFAALPARVARAAGDALPGGVAHRSGGHALLMRSAKRLKCEIEGRFSDGRGFDALGRAWNSELGLRVGDRVAVDCVGPRPALDNPKTWTHEGLVAAGWKDSLVQRLHVSIKLM